ncbi:reverse transcriptase [Senna tora]|uniref:Reverse transcriptase n=1 Tax=Senna tora TaxID=362788 RepID=A0A834XCK1_9FABA|nr:reverse transcriptase [Senna tora]
MKEPGFINLAEVAWKESNSSVQGLGLIRDRAREWNRNSFGNIFYRKKVLIRRLEGINRAMCQGPKPHLVRLEQELALEYQKVLNQEELWASKSRVDWLSLGDSNTSFFHASVNMRRRSNKISVLKDNMGNWVYEKEAINQHIVSYFNNCFNSPHLTQSLSPVDLPQLNNFQSFNLGDVPSSEEIKSALWNLKPFKAPRIDGFQPGFFQKCWGPGLSVNIDKSSVWFSPNTPVCDRVKAVQTLGFGESPKPGKYLGFPLDIRKRVSDFKPFVDKVLDKVENWKAKHLSKAGKVTLINSVCSPLISYFMQCTAFPAKVCQSIDKIFRDFFWASGTENRKFHLVGWDIICNPKKDGGLGIVRSRERNLAFLAKLCWRSEYERDSTWAKVLSRYLKDDGVVSRSSWSPLGKSLRVGLKILKQGLKKNIFSGKGTKFWEDDWLSLGPIRSLIQGPLNKNDHSLSVNNVARDLGVWNWDCLSFDLPCCIKRKIQAVACCKDRDDCDSSYWKLTPSGNFTLKTAYELLCGSRVADSSRVALNVDMRWIWRLHCSPKIRIFIWQLVLNATPCKTILAARGIMLNIVCPLCAAGVESIEHLFFNCWEVKKVWEVLKITPSNLSMGDCVNSWVKDNALLKTIKNLGVSHGVLFVFGLWEIWLGRNAKVFENKTFDAKLVGKRAVFKAAEFIHLNVNLAPSRASEVFSVGWLPPPAGWWKINTDGSCQNNLIGGGGVIRDANGNWVHGFNKWFGEGNSLMAELWAIFEGLKLAKRLFCHNIMIETDSLTAVNLITSCENRNHNQFSTLVSICKATLSDFSDVKVVHVHREGNTCADILAKLAVSSRSPLMYFDKLPPCISSAFAADLVGIKFSRSRSSVNALAL